MTHVLVVDDEPDLEALILQRFRKRIAAGEIRFVFARHRIEALATIEATPDLDLVLSDINMPRMDGLALLRTLQEAAEPLATVIVSAYCDMSNIRAAMNGGAFDFLVKPIDFADVEVSIGKTMRQIESRAGRRILGAQLPVSWEPRWLIRVVDEKAGIEALMR